MDVILLQAKTQARQQIACRWQGTVHYRVDMLIFFWDPFEPMPHDPDVKALLRIAAVWNIPVACNQTSADFMVASPLFAQVAERLVPDYDAYMAKRQG